MGHSYHHLAGKGDDVDFTAFGNPDSVRVMADAKVEPSVLGDAPDARYQSSGRGIS